MRDGDVRGLYFYLYHLIFNHIFTIAASPDLTAPPAITSAYPQCG